MLRMWIGKKYYFIKRFWYWYISKKKFANNIQKNSLSFEIFTHRTIILRKLRNIDMWMQYNKITNLKISIKELNWLVIKPWEIFSYWRQIGKPTKNKWYVEWMILHEGKVKSWIGGGLCQLSNLIFWITLHTPLTIIERWRHAYDVFPDVKRNQPFGSGATCSYPNIDLQIKNNTSQTFQLKLEIKNGYLIGKWLSDRPIGCKYEVLEKNHKIKSEWWWGHTRHNEIFRKIIDENTGEEIKEFITENHAIMMYNPLLWYDE